MKKILSLFVIVLIYQTMQAQVPPRLIIRGDDMGFAHAGNLGIIASYKNGIERSVEVLVPSPWFPEAVRLLNENPGIDVGIHLALTSEWDNLKWRPLTDCKSLQDSNGYFYPMIKSIQVVGGLSLLINRYAPFFAVVLFPISLNVFLYHTILVPSGWLMGVLLIVPNLFLGYAYRKYYNGMFVRKPVL